MHVVYVCIYLYSYLTYSKSDLLMADNTAHNLQKILVDSNDLTCPVCHEFFKKPKYLSCHHSYCEECLEQILQAQSKMVCPECREVTFVPEGGVKKLADNFHINRMVTANENVKKLLQGESTTGKDLT